MVVHGVGPIVDSQEKERGKEEEEKESPLDAGYETKKGSSDSSPICLFLVSLYPYLYA